MKKIIILLFFLSLPSFAQTCFLSRSFVKSMEVLKQVYPNAGKVYVNLEVSPEWSYYKKDEIKKLIDKHSFNFTNIDTFINEGSDLEIKLSLCAGYTEMLKEKENVVFMENFVKYVNAKNSVISETFKPDSKQISVTVFPFSPLFFDDNTLLLVFDCYTRCSYKSPSGYTLYLPINNNGYDHGPDKFIFVFKRIEEGDSDKIILAKFQILYDEGLSGKIFCDSEKEVEKFLKTLRNKTLITN